MKHFTLSNYFISNAGIDKEILEKLTSYCNVKKIEKGSFLLKEGDKCQHSFFVEKGLLKQYSIDKKGKEHILQFAPQGWFMSDRESVFFNKPSSYFIQTIEDSTVVFIEEDLLIKLAVEDNNFLRFNNRLLHNHIKNLQKRITLLQSASAEERYLDFIDTYPDILLRVPQTYVASYLGITPESLSRIRKEMADRYKAK